MEMENHENNSEAAALRQKAVELLKHKPSKHDSQLSDVENLQLLFELEVHQIELELQNEELRNAQAVAEVANDKYIRLYDLAPSGYFTLSRNGEIIEFNLAGALMLGKDRSHLINNHFHFFISKDTQDVFKLFLEKSFKNNTKESCEVTLTTSGNQPVYVHLSGIVTESMGQCFVTVVDITERRQQELKIIELNTNLEQTVYRRTAQYQEALSRLEKIADRVPGVVYQFQLNPDGSSCFPFASYGIHDIYRVSPDEVIHDASAVFTRLHPDDFDGVVASIQTSAKNNTIWQHEYRVKFDDGTSLCFSVQ